MDLQSILLFLIFLVLTTLFIVGNHFDPEVDEEDYVIPTVMAPDSIPVDSVNDSKSERLSTRFGLTVNRGQAHSTGSRGGQSGSQAITFKYDVGILRPGLAYQPIYSRTGSISNSFTKGPAAPHTWAGAYNNPRFGGSYSGYQGGRGSAMANTYTQSKKVLLNPFDGTVLYSNLKIPAKNSTQQNQTESLNALENPMKEEKVRIVKIKKKEEDQLILV